MANANRMVWGWKYRVKRCLHCGWRWNCPVEQQDRIYCSTCRLPASLGAVRPDAGPREPEPPETHGRPPQGQPGPFQ